MNNNGHIKARRKLIEEGTSNNKIIGLGFFKKDGTFRGDDKSTPNVNEAWENE